MSVSFPLNICERISICESLPGYGLLRMHSIVSRERRCAGVTVEHVACARAARETADRIKAPGGLLAEQKGQAAGNGGSGSSLSIVVGASSWSIKRRNGRVVPGSTSSIGGGREASSTGSKEVGRQERTQSLNDFEWHRNFAAEKRSDEVTGRDGDDGDIGDMGAGAMLDDRMHDLHRRSDFFERKYKTTHIVARQLPERPSR